MKEIATLPILKLLKLHEDAQLPKEATVGLDISSINSLEILPNRIVPTAYVVHTGIALEVPKGYHGKVFLRSHIGATTKLRLANGTGIIDSDYRGELLLLVENIGQYSEYISKGQQIAQLVIEKNENFKIAVVDKLSATTCETADVATTETKKKVKGDL